MKRNVPTWTGPNTKIAKELDPKDPTPHFYDAIRKQTINRPVEALHDFEKSIELNDNRAVYRSKLNLDSDEAARSSSLARIYSDLGFQELALVEGWKSVNTDPTNHSAHRFLADSYSVRPRHEIARVSELLQSQLLQPINITPVQPRLAESNLFLISSSGPGAVSFNEFNPIFNRNGAAAQFSTLAGENDTVAGEIVLSAIQNKLSWSLGYSNFQTDGWRQNADQEDQIANAFVQYELSYKTSIQAEFRYRETDRGDTELRFFEDDFVTDYSDEKESSTFRLGFRHSFAPDSNLIGNFSYNKSNTDQSGTFFLDPNVSGFPLPLVEDVYDGELDEDAYTAELQHLYRSQYVNTVAGAGYSKAKEDFTINDQFLYPVVSPPIVLLSTTDDFKLDIDHYNVYLYSYLNFLKNVTFTVGASGDFYDQDETQGGGNRDQDENQFNPKFGITYNPHPSTTLRGAVFRTLKRVLISDQTVEPTQVAGFNQFFDDINATKAWNYGLALDQKFPKNIYGGLEGTYRDLKVPFFAQTGAQYDLSQTKWDEYMGRAYLYWTPRDWLALRAEYQYEKFERNEELTLGLKQAETHSVPLGINFFHPSGFSCGLKGTYYDQDGKYERQALITGEIESADDNFFLVDAAVSYRFPKRYGFITLGVTNLFDEDFEYYDTDLNNPLIQPDRVVFGKVTLALP